ncbi:hypothetical protein Y1Q_0022484 [Alligator mississippiensis]|uniref:Uncharacterized protein n=1 Tax=Alligator mississippiensis TaxID=8496 RepID=A0A151N0D2_ALLMI|nr:hypothetical protein Y1Q_0022484 [Alligator mississippiensis]
MFFSSKSFTEEPEQLRLMPKLSKHLAISNNGYLLAIEDSRQNYKKPYSRPKRDQAPMQGLRTSSNQGTCSHFSWLIAE